MRYADSAEQEAWRHEVRAFVRRHVTPALRAELRASGNEGEGPLARAFHRQLFDKGWWGIGWPQEFGGLGKSAVDQYIFIEEMEAAGAPGMRLSITSVAPTIRRVGTEEQKQRWLPPILHGDIDFAIGYSEPDAGKHKGVSLLIVPMDRPGITVQGLDTWSGIRTNAVFFEDVRVPRDHLIGERGNGFYYVMMALDFERITLGSTGLLRRLLEELKTFVRRTIRDGRQLGAVPWVRRALADLEMRVEVGRQLGLLNAWLIDQGIVPTKEGSIAKVYVTELNARLSSVGMEILGLAGQLAPDDPAAPLHGRLQWLYTTAPLQRFGGGTNEIQRCIIAQRGLGLPRK
ncbi:MAG: acyl-CoA dehydrogenase [Deltaproteobacteria bacterium]|nr:MAG: acyl-CoA dehydrogenase [Deltaproteobacteria bacterium]